MICSSLALKAAGADVSAVASVAAANVSFVAQRPQLVISDLAMPGSDGYQFIEWVRSRSVADGGQVPVLALTAMASAFDRQQTLTAGFNAHCNKPVDVDDLVELIKCLLHPLRWQQQDEAPAPEKPEMLSY